MENDKNTSNKKVSLQIDNNILVTFIEEDILDFEKSIYLCKDKIELNDEVIITIIKEVIKKQMPLKLKIRGKSMLPFIINGQKLTIIPPSENYLNVGSIVAFINPLNKRFIIHRIIKRKNDYFLLKGDAVLKTDGWINKNDILGVIYLKEKYKNLRVFLNRCRFWYFGIKFIHLLPKAYRKFLKILWYNLLNNYSFIYFL